MQNKTLTEVYKQIKKMPQPTEMKKTPEQIGYMWMDQGLDYKAMFDASPDECARLCSLRYHKMRMPNG